MTAHRGGRGFGEIDVRQRLQPGKGVVTLLAVASLLFQACATRAPSLQTLSWSTAVESVQRLSLTNRYGNVHVRPASSGLVGITAVVQCRRTVEAMPLAESRSDDALTLEVDGGDCARVDLTAHVDPTVALRLETDSGSIEARKLGNAISAHSTSGDISVVSDGPLEASSFSGTVRLNPITPKWRHTHSIRTETGDVIVVIPGAEVSIQACSRGEITFDPALKNLSKQRTDSCATAFHGSGGSRIDIRSETGRVALHAEARWARSRLELMTKGES